MTTVQKFMLYALGACTRQIEARLKVRHVTLAMTKAEFIRLVQRSHIVKQRERVLYQHLQRLESQRYLAYDERTLSLTKRGERVFERLNRDLSPYVELTRILAKEDLLRALPGKQTRLAE